MANEIVPYNTSKALQEVDPLRALIALARQRGAHYARQRDPVLASEWPFPSFYALQLRNKRSAEELRSHACQLSEIALNALRWLSDLSSVTD